MKRKKISTEFLRANLKSSKHFVSGLFLYLLGICLSVFSSLSHFAGPSFSLSKSCRPMASLSPSRCSTPAINPDHHSPRRGRKTLLHLSSDPNTIPGVDRRDSISFCNVTVTFRRQFRPPHATISDDTTTIRTPLKSSTQRY